MTAKAQRHSIPEHSESSRKGCSLKHDLSVTSWIKIINTLWVKESKVSQEIRWFAELRCAPAELKSDSYKWLSSRGQRSFLIVCSYISHSFHCQSVTSQEPCRLPTCRCCWVGNFSPSSWHPLSHPFLRWSLPIPPLLSHMQQEGRKKTKPSSVPVDMWLCLAFWILLSVRISFYVFFTKMTVFLFPWQPQQDQIDSPLKAADDKRH